MPTLSILLSTKNVNCLKLTNVVIVAVVCFGYNSKAGCPAVCAASPPAARPPENSSPLDLVIPVYVTGGK